MRSQATELDRSVISPDPAGVLANNLAAGGAVEGLLELGHVGDDAVDPVAAGGVGVGLGAQLGALLGGGLAPDLAPAEEEALLGGEAVARGFRRGLEGFLQGRQGDADAAVVGGVLAEGEAAVEVGVAGDGEGRVFVGEAGGALL